MHLALLQSVHGLLGAVLIQRESLNNRLDAVVCGKCQHILVHRAGRDQSALNHDAASEDRGVWDDEVLATNGQREDARPYSHHGHDDVPVRQRRGCDQQAVELPDVLGLALGVWVTILIEVGGGDEAVGTKAGSLLLLAVGAGDDDDTAAHLVGELDGEVAEAADADDADRVSGLDAEQRGEDGRAAALQRRGVLGRQRVGNGVQEGLAPHGLFGEATLVGLGDAAVHLARGAVGLVTREALLAQAAGAGLEAPADALTRLQLADLGTDGLDGAHAFMAENNVVIALAEMLVVSGT